MKKCIIFICSLTPMIMLGESSDYKPSHRGNKYPYEYNGEVDEFNAGPLYVAKVNDVSPIHLESKENKIVLSKDRLTEYIRALWVNSVVDHFTFADLYATQQNCGGPMFLQILIELCNKAAPGFVTMYLPQEQTPGTERSGYYGENYHYESGKFIPDKNGIFFETHFNIGTPSDVTSYILEQRIISLSCLEMIKKKIEEKTQTTLEDDHSKMTYTITLGPVKQGQATIIIDAKCVSQIAPDGFNDLLYKFLLATRSEEPKN